MELTENTYRQALRTENENILGNKNNKYAFKPKCDTL